MGGKMWREHVADASIFFKGWDEEGEKKPPFPLTHLLVVPPNSQGGWTPTFNWVGFLDFSDNGRSSARGTMTLWHVWQCLVHMSEQGEAWVGKSWLKGSLDNHKTRWFSYEYKTEAHLFWVVTWYHWQHTLGRKCVPHVAAACWGLPQWAAICHGTTGR